MDWSQIQSFALVAEHGSLSAAARAAGASQPTLSRHISQLESNLGARLMTRSKNGITLTEAGNRLQVHAESMRDAVAHFDLATVNQQVALSGTVRITASAVMAGLVLPEIITELSRAEPALEIELVATDETHNLLRREADIAIRMYRPEQLDVFTRKIGEIELGAFAHNTYLEKFGVPNSLAELKQHKLIGYDRSTLIIDGFKKAGLSLDRNAFAFRSDNQIVCWNMVLAGFGIGFGQSGLTENHQDIVKLPFSKDIGHLPVWLTAHQELKTNPRVRRVFDFLAKALSEGTLKLNHIR